MIRPSNDYNRWRSDWTLEQVPWVSEETNRFFYDNYGEISSYFDQELAPKALVPLCGDSGVLRFLFDRNFEVTGVEYVAEAVTRLIGQSFSDLTWHQQGQEIVQHQAAGMRICQQDFFTFDANSQYSFVYDRGALVALEPKLRQEYAQKIIRALSPGGVYFVEIMESQGYHPSNAPFPVSQVELRELYPQMEQLPFHLEKRYLPDEMPERFVVQGVKQLARCALLFRKPKR
ncbi:MAG: hypothetical protein KDD42_06105 [Bdellovibrionales bacterium]|nr:hypothetical protein [Bdellovibrionales bacterium]